MQKKLKKEKKQSQIKQEEYMIYEKKHKNLKNLNLFLIIK